MPGLVPHDATHPFEIAPQKESVWICQCGLSQDLPFATEVTRKLQVNPRGSSGSTIRCGRRLWRRERISSHGKSLATTWSSPGPGMI
jgi:hypothetical protein